MDAWEHDYCYEGIGIDWGLCECLKFLLIIL